MEVSELMLMSIDSRQTSKSCTYYGHIEGVNLFCHQPTSHIIFVIKGSVFVLCIALSTENSK